ncbi:MAG: Stage 0 sporulation protein J [Chlamydiae bacterium]|nr:Stage 0 sporulation protein J [Chlamydiota bacterium]
MSEQIEIIEIDLIKSNPFQPRIDSFETEKLNEMAQTIKQVGLIHPPLVRKTSEGVYELIAGERRYRAAKLAGLKQIPVLIKTASDSQSSLSALIENIQRVDLNPIEIAKAMKSIASSLSLTQEQLSSVIGVKRPSIANHMRLLSLPTKIQDALIEKTISLGHAKVILSLENKKEQTTLCEVIVRSNLTVREAEQKAEALKVKTLRKPAPSKSSRNIFLEQIKDMLQNKMGTKVDFVGDEKKGTIQLHYYSLSDLNRLLHELGYSEE